jgi:hypothetical protein
MISCCLLLQYKLFLKHHDLGNSEGATAEVLSKPRSTQQTPAPGTPRIINNNRIIAETYKRQVSKDGVVKDQPLTTKTKYHTRQPRRKGRR